MARSGFGWGCTLAREGWAAVTTSGWMSTGRLGSLRPAMVVRSPSLPQCDHVEQTQPGE